MSWLSRAREHLPVRDLVAIALPHRAAAMLAAYGLHVHRRACAEDLEAREPELVRVVLDAARAIGRVWFRAEVEGVEHVPERGAALLVGNHNGGFLTFDTFLTMAAVERRYGIERAVRPLAHDFLFDDRHFRRLALGFGAVRAGHRPAERALARGDLVLVYPGGDLDTFRPFRDRGRIELGERTGFVRLALRAGVPIVPVVSAGTHEQFVVLWRGDAFARAIRLHQWARADIFPVGLSLPWGLGISFLPYLPLPAQTTVAFGAPLAWPELGPDAANDEVVVRRCRDQVRAAMQDLLDGLMRGRIPWIGQPARARSRARGLPDRG